jgi:putative endopeptidase
MNLRPIAVLVPLLAWACSAPESSEPRAQSHPGLVLADLDPSVDPGVDFYRFANGGWLDRNPVPADEALWGVFSEVKQRNEDVLRRVLERSAASPRNALERKLGDFYASGMDERTIESAGTLPLIGHFAAIDGLAEIGQLPRLLAGLHGTGSSGLFSVRSGADMTDATRTILFVSQGGLGLPERDYYLREDAESARLRESYRAHVARMLELAGTSAESAARGAATVLELETELARVAFGAVELRNPKNRLNRITTGEADAITPHFDWTAYLGALRLDASEPLNLTGPKYFAGLDALLVSRPVEDWRVYLRWRLLDDNAEYLPKSFDDEHFDFFGRVLGGAKEQRPRWKRVLDATGGAMGEILSQAFVAEAFSPAAKARCQAMVDDLIAAFRARIEKLPWMGEETRAKALLKLASVRSKIGYPDRWRDWQGLAVARDSFVGNRLRAREFNFRYDLDKVGKPVDKSEFRMPAYIVNASYSAANNDITFPAGILQPPFFSEQYDDALNYGAMGAVIGHELTHGFDDGGSQYDAVGNLANWWTDQDRREFERRIQVVEQQFSAYVAVDDLKVNGKLTLGENLADLGGLAIAYDALRRAQAQRPGEKLDGFTPEQRFYLAWARAWRCNYTPARLKLQVNTNPHSPANFRAFGPLSNLDTFQQAFGLGDEAPMMRPKDQRARVW